MRKQIIYQLTLSVGIYSNFNGLGHRSLLRYSLISIKFCMKMKHSHLMLVRYISMLFPQRFIFKITCFKNWNKFKQKGLFQCWLPRNISIFFSSLRLLESFIKYFTITNWLLPNVALCVAEGILVQKRYRHHWRCRQLRTEKPFEDEVNSWDHGRKTATNR